MTPKTKKSMPRAERALRAQASRKARLAEEPTFEMNFNGRTYRYVTDGLNHYFVAGKKEVTGFHSSMVGALIELSRTAPLPRGDQDTIEGYIAELKANRHQFLQDLGKLLREHFKKV